MIYKLSNLITQVSTNYVISEPIHDEMTFLIDKDDIVITLPTFQSIITIVVASNNCYIRPSSGDKVNNGPGLKLANGWSIKLQKYNNNWYVINFSGFELCEGTITTTTQSELLNPSPYVDLTIMLQVPPEIVCEPPKAVIPTYEPVPIVNRCKVPKKPYKTTRYKTTNGFVLEIVDTQRGVINYNLNGKVLNTNASTRLLRYGINHPVTGTLIEHYCKTGEIK